MKRRSAIGHIISVIGVAVIAPSCLTDSESKMGEYEFSVKEEELLSGMVDALIPGGQIPGAKFLQVDKYILIMLHDCYEKQEFDLFKTNLNEFDHSVKEKYKKHFLKCTDSEKVEILKQYAANRVNKNSTRFFSLLKNLAVEGYMQSEYVMKNISKYRLIPGHFYGCFPVE